MLEKVCLPLQILISDKNILNIYTIQNLNDLITRWNSTPTVAEHFQAGAASHPKRSQRRPEEH